MKFNSKYLFFAAALVGLSSCAIQEVEDYNVPKPEVLAQYEYLKDFDVLKSYISENASPDFKLGAAVTASEFNKQQQEFLLAKSNFHEVTAGNAMKHASVVDKDGNMNFGTVEAFVDAAKAGGLTIYGHTLAWHSQQSNQYLNKLLADKELPPAKAEGFCMHINTSAAQANPWDWQMYYDLDSPLKAGVTYSFSIRTKSTGEGSFPFWMETPDAGNTHYGQPPINFKKTWSETAFDVTPNTDCSRLLFNFGQFGGDLYFDDIVLTEKGSDVNLIVNGDFAKKEIPANWAKPSWHNHLYEVVEAMADAAVEIEVEKEEARTCIMIESDDMVEAAWDTQFWLMLDSSKPLVEGDKWEVSMEVRADKAATSSTQTHKEAGGYLHWAAIGSVSFTTDWTTYSASGSVDASMAGGYSFAFNLNDFAKANKYYFDNVSIKINGVEMITNGNCDDPNGTANFVAKEKRGATGPARIVDKIKYTVIQSSNAVPLTPEEKKDTLTWAMDKWISGMMEATQGYVTTWDVVNEAISGADGDGDGKYDLQSATNGDASGFYWQDYLGNEDYVPTVVNMARKYYKGTEPLVLFINDYNLESDWDDNAKLKSLIEWIKVWEAKGIKIDGIGSQMHVSCYANEATQKSKEEHYVKMLELMVATGKLVKISELDMGYVDANGKDVATSDMTEEQHKAMANYYKFIVSKYFEIVPADQQYGITQWCIADSPAGSGWRAGQPVGLWDSGYGRKHTYAGFAEGLQGN